MGVIEGGAMTSGHGHGHGRTDAGVQAALLTAIPFAVAAAVSFVIAHRSQRMNEKVMHVGVPYMASGALYALFPIGLSISPVLGFVFLTLGIVGIYSGAGTSVALLQELSAGPGFVVAAPLYNSIGILGGFIGPLVVGSLVQRTHSFAVPSVLMAACLSLAGMMVTALPYLLALPPSIRVGLIDPKPVSSPRR